MRFDFPPVSLDYYWFWLALGASALTTFCYVGALAIAWLRILCAWGRETRQWNYTPGITVLKPIAGVDEQLDVNIRSFMEANYDDLQLIFCSDNARDPGIEVVRRIVQEYPQRDVLILEQHDTDVATPKMANLRAMLPHAKHEFILLSDSNVRVRKNDLRRMVGPMQNSRVGLVYQPVTGIGEETPAAFVENFRLTEFAGLLTIGAKLLFFQDIVMGKGMLCRRKALAEAGDFSRVLDVAADDHLLGMAILSAGWKLRQSDAPAYVFHQKWSWTSLYARHLRHSALRWRICWPAYPLEIFFNPIVCSIPALFVCGWTGLFFFFAAIIIKIMAEVVSASALRGKWPSIRLWPHILTKDLLSCFVWWHALFQSTVSWRGVRYRMTWGTRLIRLPEVK